MLDSSEDQSKESNNTWKSAHYFSSIMSCPAGAAGNLSFGGLFGGITVASEVKPAHPIFSSEFPGTRQWGYWYDFSWRTPWPTSFARMAALRSDDSLHMWVSDKDGTLWHAAQLLSSGEWTEWEANWNNARASGAVQEIVSVSQYSSGGTTQLWVFCISGDNSLMSAHYGGSEWNSWAVWSGPQFRSVTVVQKSDGHLTLWGVDLNFQLWIRYEIGEGYWSVWSKLDAPELVRIVACRPGGDGGTLLWAIGKDLNLYNAYEERNGNWTWSKPGWMGAPPLLHDLTATQQTDGTARLWVAEKGRSRADERLLSIAQKSAGEWGSWEPPV